MPIYYLTLYNEKISLKDYCDFKGIPYISVLRLKNQYNLTPEDAINCYYGLLEDEPYLDRKIVFNGKLMSVLDYCKMKHIAPKTMKTYICGHKDMSLNDIINFYEDKLWNLAHTSHRFYNIWKNMLDRCYKKTSVHYDDYGGRGIQVCDRWRL